MDRRTFFGGASAGLAGLLFSREAEAVAHELVDRFSHEEMAQFIKGVHEIVDRGLSHEEMAQKIVNSEEFWSIEDKQFSVHWISHVGGYIKASRAKSVVIVDHLNPDLSIRITEKFDLTNFSIARRYGRDDSDSDSDSDSENYESFGRIGERWFQLG